MTRTRTLAVVIVAILAAVAGWMLLRPHQPSSPAGHLTIYYAKLDGNALGSWTVSLRPQQPGQSDAEYLHDRALYAAVQAIAGPPSDVQAIRFPTGTHVINVNVNGSIATVDLSSEVAAQNGGSFGENGEFKELVYTLTGVAPIDAVQITIAGHKVETLPGGHLELDAPLRRSDW